MTSNAATLLALVALALTAAPVALASETCAGPACVDESSTNRGTCPTTQNALVSNEASANLYVTDKEVGVRAFTSCATYGRGESFRDARWIDAGGYAADYGNNVAAYAEFAWTSHSASGTEKCDTWVYSIVMDVPLGCPQGPPPVVPALLP